MIEDILDKKFIHHTWFTNANITVKQAIEYFASNINDFKLVKIRKSLLKNMEYDYFLYGLEDGNRWKMSAEEAAYYLFRLEFYIRFWKIHNNVSDLKKIPEYVDFIKAVNA